jgi:hypothetical protein
VGTTDCHDVFSIPYEDGVHLLLFRKEAVFKGEKKGGEGGVRGGVGGEDLKDPDIFMEWGTDEKVGIGEETSFCIKVGEDVVETGMETVGDGLA